MPVNDVQRLVASRQVSLVAAAGCGKTQLIAEAARAQTSLPDLILTHTNAGVAALRGRLSTLGAKRSDCRVETIAGLSLRYASAYPAISRLSTEVEGDSDWNLVYDAAQRLFAAQAIGDVIRVSYSGIYVDEYQDCNSKQHAVILALARILPCRVLGDPLQAIFGFKDNPIVSWEGDVLPYFDPLPEKRYPHRWDRTNPALGAWLGDARDRLQREQPVSLQGGPAIWIHSDRNLETAQRRAYWNAVNRARPAESVVVIHHRPRGWQRFARNAGGPIQCIEPADCPDLHKAAKSIEEAVGCARALAVVDFAKRCIAGVSAPLSSIQTALKAGRGLSRIRKLKGQAQALDAVVAADDVPVVASALRSISDIPGARVFRSELFREMLRALEGVRLGTCETLVEAGRHVRDMSRKVGRRTSRVTLGTTLLLKGLEFDHAVVLDGTAHDTKNLYVALTRGTRSLTIVSGTPTLTPSGAAQVRA